MIEIERDALLTAARAVIDVVEARNTIAVLSNLLLVAEDGRLTLTGTDLDLEASTSIDATGEMCTTIDAQKLLAAVQSFKPGRVTIAAASGAVKIMQKRGTRTLPTLGAENFPKRPPMEDARSFTIASASLSRLLDTTHVAQSTEETRYYLNGIFVHAVADKMRSAATDGHRLIRAEVPLPEGAVGMADIIIPTKCVRLIRKLLAKYEGAVAVSVTPKAIGFDIGDSVIVSKLIDGTFPDYTRVIPPDTGKHRLVLARDALTEPVGAVAAVVNAEGDKMKVRAVVIEIGDADAHEVSAKDSSGASATEPFDCEAKGGAVRLGVNHGYLTQVAGIFAEIGTLTLTFEAANAPVLMTGDKDPDLVAVIMPMRA